MSRYFPTREECGHHLVFGKVSVTTYAGENVQVSFAEIPEDGIVDWHQHPNEQLGIMVQGRAMFYIGEEVKELGVGEIFWIPSNVRHKVVPVDGPAKAVDIFYPIREEYK